MNEETVHSVKEKSMYRNAKQLNTVIKESTNEEGLMNQRKKRKKEKKRERKREREKWKHQGLHATEVKKKKKKKSIVIHSVKQLLLRNRPGSDGATFRAKDYKGHSLVQTSFTEPPNSVQLQH